MLNVSDRALAIIDEVRANLEAGNGGAIVLFRKEDGGVGFAVGTAAASDQVIVRDGQPTIIVAGDLAEPFDGWILDFVATANRGHFILRQP